MANYKLVNSDQLDTDMKTVADKIREKAQLSDLLSWPSGYIEGIDQCSSLNFAVVGGTEQPIDPKENTIWVNTNKEITNWIMDANQPENLTEGMVWISAGTSSTVAFNALKKNGIQVYPLSAKQYVSGAWVDVTAMSYQGGKWVEWFVWNGELYDSGKEYESVTGGWFITNGRTSGYDLGEGTKNADSITLNCPNESTSVAATTTKSIDLTNYSTLKVNITDIKRFVVLVIDKKQNMGNTGAADLWIEGTGVFSLDVSSFTGSYYVSFSTWHANDEGATRAEFDKVWME